MSNILVHAFSSATVRCSPERMLQASEKKNEISDGNRDRKKARYREVGEGVGERGYPIFDEDDR